MTWLDGIPSRERSVRWSPEAEIFRTKALSKLPRKCGTCILDDRICTFMSYMDSSGQGETAIYLGDITIDSASVLMQEIALIPLYLVSIQLLPLDRSRRALFASVEVTMGGANICFRVHARDGFVMQNKQVPGTAAFGRIVAHQDILAICVSSGKEPAQRDYVLNNRIDFTSSRQGTDDRPGYPDTIVCWDIKKDVSWEVNASQPPEFPMLTSGNFEFVSANRVALAGHVEQFFADVTAGLLKCFNIQGSSQKDATFKATSDMNAEIGMIDRSVGIPGSSIPSDIFLHLYSGDRMSIFHKDLLSGKIEIDEDDDTLIEAVDYSDLHRTLRAHFSKYLPSISGNRALVQGSMGSAFYDGPSRLLLLDFEPERVQRLVNLTENARTSLGERFKAVNAAVKVVTRRVIHYADGCDEDDEYTDKTRPVEWQAHLNEIQKTEQEREDDLPPLEYDEAPEEHRGEDLFGCVASVLQLPKDIKIGRVGLTTSAVVAVEDYIFSSGGFGPSWRVFDFSNEVETGLDAQT